MSTMSFDLLEMMYDDKCTVSGDLVRELKLGKVSPIQEWKISLSVETSDGDEYELDFELPECHYDKITSGCDSVMIVRENGLESPWLGLGVEAIDVLAQLENVALTAIQCEIGYM